MGFRVTGDCGFLPAGIHDGALWVRWRDKVKSIPSGTGSLIFREQCNFVADAAIRCYLVNEEYKFILWENGSAIVMHKASRTLRANLTVNDFKSLYCPVAIGVVGGYLPRKIKGLMTLQYATLKVDERLSLLYSNNVPFCFSVDMESRQMEIFNSLCNGWTELNLLPRFTYQEETGQVWYEEKIGGQKTELKGELFHGKSFIRLGGGLA